MSSVHITQIGRPLWLILESVAFNNIEIACGIKRLEHLAGGFHAIPVRLGDRLKFGWRIEFAIPDGATLDVLKAIRDFAAVLRKPVQCCNGDQVFLVHPAEGAVVELGVCSWVVIPRTQDSRAGNGLPHATTALSTLLADLRPARDATQTKVGEVVGSYRGLHERCVRIDIAVPASAMPAHLARMASHAVPLGQECLYVGGARSVHLTSAETP